MAYTQADLDNVRAARLALATGSRVVSVTAGDRTVNFGQEDMDKLVAFEAEIQASLETASKKRRFVLTTTGKGL